MRLAMSVFDLNPIELIVLFEVLVIALCLLGPWAAREQDKALQFEADRLARVAAYREEERAEQAEADERYRLRQMVNEHLDQLWKEKQRRAKEMA